MLRIASEHGLPQRTRPKPIRGHHLCASPTTATQVKQDSVVDRPLLSEPASSGARERSAQFAAVAAILLLGLVARYLLVHSGVGDLNSDEATTGLMARGIMRGEFPVMVAGNSYGGTLEAYAAAALFFVTGLDGFALKAIPTLSWLGACVALFFVARTMLSRVISLAVSCLLWVYSSSTTLLSIQAYSGYGSGLVATILSLGLLVGEVMRPEGAQWNRGRVARLLLLGLLSSIAIWQHPMYLAPLLPAHAYVVATRFRSALRYLAPVGLGAAIGALPTLAYNLRHDWATLHLKEQNPVPVSSYGSRFVNFFFELFPRLSGLKAIDGTWIGNGLGETIFLLLFACFVWSIVRLIRGTPGDRLLAAAAIGGPFLIAVPPTSYYYDDARYGIWYAPILLLVVARAVVLRLPQLQPTAAQMFLLAYAWFALFCWPAQHHLTGPIRLADPDDGVERLADAMKAANVRYARADYWIAYRLTFLSEERIIATPFAPVRFSRYERAVDATRRPALLAFPGDGRDQALQATRRDLQRQEVGGFALYVPQ